MADAPATLEHVARVARILRAADVRFAFIGGIALNAWAIPRATFDLDVAIAADESRSIELLRRFEADGFSVEPTFLSGYRDRISGMEKVHVYLPAGAALLAVDLFFASTGFLRSLLARRTAVDLGGAKIEICSAADLILLKLVAGRAKDQVDVRNLLAVQGVPERDYLERWANDLAIRDRLDAALASAA